MLIDLNLQFGDAVLFVHDHKPATNLADVAQNIQRLDASFLAGSLVKVSPNYGVLAAPEDPGQAMEVKPEHVEVLLNVAVNHSTSSCSTSAAVLDAVTIKALDRANHIFPVMQLTLPFVRDAKRLLAAFRSLGYSEGKDPLGGQPLREGRRDRSLRMSSGRSAVAPFKTLPNSYEAVAAAVNQGRPIASFARNNPVAKACRSWRKR